MKKEMSANDLEILNRAAISLYGGNALNVIIAGLLKSAIERTLNEVALYALTG